LPKTLPIHQRAFNNKRVNMVTHNDWSFKDPNKCEDKVVMIKKYKKKKYKRRRNVASIEGSEFYRTEQWRKLRYKVLKNHEGSCMCCGRSKVKDGVTVHVDHIKPRSKHPKLSLDYNNLQILCEDCNVGKSNTDVTDWREKDIDRELDEQLLTDHNLWKY